MLDFSALISPAMSAMPPASLVRMLESASGTTAILQIDQTARPNGANWTTIAQLDGVHTGNSVTVIFDASQPAATMFVAPAADADPRISTATVTATSYGRTAAARPRYG